jgi:hypothetical protein
MSKTNKEEWYPAMYKGEPINYEITKTGKIRSNWYRDKRILRGRLNQWGYPTYVLRINNKSYNRFAHTVMAHTFLTLPEGRTYDNISVNHKDSNKENTNIENLEYCSFTANQLHKFDSGMQYKTRGKVNCNIYKFTHDDGRVLISTPRELFYKYGIEDGLFMSGINQLVRGYSITTGWTCSHHKGWRKELVRERNLKQFQQEMTGDRAMIYQHFMNKDDNDYRTKTKERSKENTELKRTAKKLFTLNENR